MDNPILIEFKGGGFVLIENPLRVQVFISRHDINVIEYIILDDNHIEGSLVKNIKGQLVKSRVKYV